MTIVLPGSILDQTADQLGGSATLLPTSNPTGGQGSRVLQLTGKDHCITDVVVISLGLEFPADCVFPTLCNHQIRGRVTWGSHKGKNSALIDWKHGTRVTVEGSAVDVTALYGFAPLPTGQPSNDGPSKVICYASVGPGTLGKTQDVTLTQTTGPGDLVIGGTQLFLIPSFARAVEVQDRRDPSAAVLPLLTVAFFAGQTAASRPISRFNDTYNPITIPNGAESILVTNASQSVTEANLIFHLDM